VVIGEPRRDEKKDVHSQVAFKKDEMGKNKLTITIGPSLQKKITRNKLQRRANDEAVAAAAAKSAELTLGVGLADSLVV
jgi:hypothetical protein